MHLIKVSGADASGLTELLTAIGISRLTESLERTVSSTDARVGEFHPLQQVLKDVLPQVQRYLYYSRTAEEYEGLQEMAASQLGQLQCVPAGGVFVQYSLPIAAAAASQPPPGNDKANAQPSTAEALFASGTETAAEADTRLAVTLPIPVACALEGGALLLGAAADSRLGEVAREFTRLLNRGRVDEDLAKARLSSQLFPHVQSSIRAPLTLSLVYSLISRFRHAAVKCAYF